MKTLVRKGQSNSTGFEIKGSGIKVHSKKYQEDNSEELMRVSKRFGFIGLLLFLFSAYGHFLLLIRHKIGASRLCLSTIFLIVLDLLIYAFFILFLEKESAQWHACEHKVANLLNKDLDLTMENLKRMSRLHPYCGTQLASLLMLVLMGEYSLLVFTRISIEDSLLLIFVFISSYLSYLVMSGRRIITSPLQYLSTREPDEEKLWEALLVAWEFRSEFEGRNDRDADIE